MLTAPLVRGASRPDAMARTRYVRGWPSADAAAANCARPLRFCRAVWTVSHDSPCCTWSCTRRPTVTGRMVAVTAARAASALATCPPCWTIWGSASTVTRCVPVTTTDALAAGSSAAPATAPAPDQTSRDAGASSASAQQAMDLRTDMDDLVFGRGRDGSPTGDGWCRSWL